MDAQGNEQSHSVEVQVNAGGALVVRLSDGAPRAATLADVRRAVCAFEFADLIDAASFRVAAGAPQALQPC